MSDTQNIPAMITTTLIVSGKSIEVPCEVKCEAYTVIVNTEAKVADTHTLPHMHGHCSTLVWDFLDHRPFKQQTGKTKNH